MNEIKPILYEIDWHSTITAILTLIVGFLAIKKIIAELFKSVGYTPPWAREREEIKQSLATITQEVHNLQSDRADDQKRLCTYECKMEECQTKIKQCIESLKKDIINGNIDRMRWEILDFASKIRKDDCNKESYDHIIETYDRYVIILKDNNLENGRVDAAMDYIRERYAEHLEHGFPY